MTHVPLFLARSWDRLPLLHVHCNSYFSHRAAAYSLNLRSFLFTPCYHLCKWPSTESNYIWWYVKNGIHNWLFFLICLNRNCDSQLSQWAFYLDVVLTEVNVFLIWNCYALSGNLPEGYPSWTIIYQRSVHPMRDYSLGERHAATKGSCYCTLLHVILSFIWHYSAYWY